MFKNEKEVDLYLKLTKWIKENIPCVLTFDGGKIRYVVTSNSFYEDQSGPYKLKLGTIRSFYDKNFKDIRTDPEGEYDDETLENIERRVSHILRSIEDESRVLLAYMGEDGES